MDDPTVSHKCRWGVLDSEGSPPPPNVDGSILRNPQQRTHAHGGGVLDSAGNKPEPTIPPAPVDNRDITVFNDPTV